MELIVHSPKLNERRQELFELAVQQAGFFTAGQARNLGYSDRLMHHHKRQGNWEEHGWGLYRLNHYPHNQEEDFVRLSLWSRNKAGVPQAVLSHESALRLFELSDVLPDKYHLTVPVGFRKNAPGDVILHPGRLGPDIQQREGFSVTTPLRALLDVANTHFALEQFDLALTQALERGLVRKARLLEALEAFPVVTRRIVTKATR
jgi:predicted transcriptional regulator of viral defense system